MGVPFSCPLAIYNDLDSSLQSLVVKSDEAKNPVKDYDSASIEESFGSGNDNNKMINEGSFRFKQRESHTLISPQITSPKDEAAVKLQKVYKSFRTRRKLADCAVLVEQSWWKLIDFAELKHSSISFFDVEHHETAISRWSRAKTRAAKVGKGLSKNAKAQKLALQHWLEAIDPRHRYGHNLHFYYAKWLESQSKEPFFYWLDIGEGKDVNLEKCPRWKLHHQCIKYLGPLERRAYEVIIENGRFVHKESGDLLDTSCEPHAKWIFVLSTSKNLYVGKKKKGKFQHSSFLAGGATLAAGRLVVENGILKSVWPHSGHYRPTPENFQEFILFLKENDVDLTDVTLDPVDNDDQSLWKQRSSLHMRNHSSEEEFVADNGVDNNSINIASAESKTDASKEDSGDVAAGHPSPSHSARSVTKLTNLKIPRRDDLLVKMQNEDLAREITVKNNNLMVEDGYDSATEQDDLEEKQEDCEEGEVIPAESIFKRINSHKEMKSFQLGKQLSCKWTTGAGPRIGCVRDYPSELQFRALEQLNLSPKSDCARTKSSSFSPGYGASSCPSSSTPIPTEIPHWSVQLSPLSNGRNPTL